MERKFHGLLLINKPGGITSHDVVAKVRRILGTKEVGHAGTLDPMARGLMVLLIGEATKLSNYILEQEKAYTVRAQLGITTDTLDTTGEILSQRPVDVSAEKVREMALSISGDFELPAPLYSAVKVAGKELHKYARNQQEVKPPMKRMSFFDLRIVGQGADWIDLDLRCSKGSYIRSWVHLLGEKLGCGAAMSSLIRTESAPYNLSQAVTLEELEANPEMGLIPVQSVLDQTKFIRAKAMDEAMIFNGTICNDLKTQLISIFKPGEDQLVRILSMNTGKLLAIIGLEPGKGFVIRRGFRY